ncbi:MAG: cytochrome c oxidase subunit II [Thermaerobacter sp.]|nr:cytochrome c oxidase subunit II [Thermaerobacter sp.]
MAYHRYRWSRLLLPLTVVTTGLLASGCGKQFVVLDPQGPVARSELHLIETTAMAMGVVVLFVLVLFAVTVLKFRDRPGNRAPYIPNWSGSRRLEFVLFAIPVLIVVYIAVPTVQQTYALDRLPPTKHPLIIDVTSLDYKWLFQYPKQGVATVNYIDVPVGVPVLFELTANSPMNTFWIPQLGGMEYSMPGRVLPLYLQADKAGVYWGRSANFSGRGFVHMVFHVKAMPPAEFSRWAQGLRTTAPHMSMQDYRQLLAVGTAREESFSAYPAGTFPTATHGFTLKGGMYLEPN